MNKRRIFLLFWVIWMVLLISAVGVGHAADAEESLENGVIDRYYLGSKEGLEITVHIWGEVRSPGLYKVRDTTNLLELISHAGGPTEYADLKKVKLTRTRKRSPRFLIIDLESYLEDEEYDVALPVLQPGDTIRITRNTWYTWRTVVRIASEVAVIANLYLWIERFSK